MPELEMHIISCSKQPMRSPEKLGRNIWYHCLVVPPLGWLRTLYQGCIRATRRKLKELRPDVVHGMGTERESALSAVLSGFPSVVTIQGNMAELARLYRPRIGSYLWLAARLEDFTLPRAAGVLCNSRYTEGIVAPRVRKTWRVAHAIRPYFLDPPPDAAPRPCAVLVVGVIQPRKRQLELLDVAEALHRRGLKCEFRFIGLIYSQADPYVQAFLQRIRPLEAAGMARYVGAVPDYELVPNFDAVAGLVHFPAEEAFGNVVCEALARDLKFFGARLGGIVDIAAEAPGAELIDGQDWAGLTEAVARWVRAGCPRPSGASALMRERYEAGVIARRHLEIYQEVLSTPS
jgi:glycosyltransferase involved in cell wall biosynthesis